MTTAGLVALALGLVVLLVCARFAPGPGGDPAMKWESRLAAGFFALLFGFPVWAAQGVLTFLATVPGDGTWWLWLAWWAAPLLGFVVGGQRRLPSA